MTSVALTGVSHWHTPMHMAALRRAGADIVGVTDPDETIAQRMAEEAGTSAYDDVQTLVRDAKPDIVMVMGRPAEVLEAAQWLVDENVPAIVEKPIGLAGPDLTRLARTAADQDAFVAVPLVNRHSALWARLHDLRAANPRLRSFHAHFRVVNGPLGRYQDLGAPWMLDPAVSGGGALRNLGIHAADAFLQFVHGEGVRVRHACIRESADHPGIDEFASLTLQSDSGIVGTIEAGYTFGARKGGDTEWRVATSDAYLIDRNQTMRAADLTMGTDATFDIPSVAERYDTFAADNLARLASGRPPSVSLADYVRATGLIDEAYALGRDAGGGTRP